MTDRTKANLQLAKYFASWLFFKFLFNYTLWRFARKGWERWG